MNRSRCRLWLGVWLLPVICLAQFEQVSLDRLVREAQVIVVGEIGAIKETDNADRYAFDLASIEILQLLRNASGQVLKEGERLRLAMPAAANKLKFKTDVRFKSGRSGVWLLRWDGEHFRAEHPSCCQPAAQLAEINRLRALRP